MKHKCKGCIWNQDKTNYKPVCPFIQCVKYNGFSIDKDKKC